MTRLDINLAALSEKINEQGATWTCGETSMTKLSLEEAKLRLGFVPPPGVPSLEDMVLALRSGKPQEPFIAASTVGAPSSYDLRNVSGQNYVTPIRDQGGCGSCVAFGAVAVLESTLRVALQNQLSILISLKLIYSIVTVEAKGGTVTMDGFLTPRSINVQERGLPSRIVIHTQLVIKTALDWMQTGELDTSNSLVGVTFPAQQLRSGYLLEVLSQDASWYSMTSLLIVVASINTFLEKKLAATVLPLLVTMTLRDVGSARIAGDPTGAKMDSSGLVTANVLLTLGLGLLVLRAFLSSRCPLNSVWSVKLRVSAACLTVSTPSG